MDVILHLGAHRTGSTSFQDYMTRSTWPEVAFWGPRVTRGGMLDGVCGSPLGLRPKSRTRGRIAINLARAQAAGAQTLVISDENLIGPLRSTLRCATLYPEVGMRMARLHTAFGGRITRVALQIRALDSYWSSALAFGLARGMACPDAEMQERIAASARRWQDVITDLACALPDVPILVTSCEQMAQRPDVVAGLVTGRAPPPMPAQGIWANRALAAPRLRACLRDAGLAGADQHFDRDGCWRPFSNAQRQTLCARTAADLAWLRTGADGLATYHEHKASKPAVRVGPWPQTIRGSEDNDSQDRYMAHPC